MRNHEQLTPEEIRDSEDHGLTAGAVLDPRNAYQAQRFEHYRTRGEDWGTASEWARKDADDLYGTGA